MRNYRRLLLRLKAAYPQHRVSVRRVRLPANLAGDCTKYGKSWVIRVSRELDEHSAMDCLIHEWPHVPAWQEWVETGEHGIIWSEHYRRCYRIFEGVADESYK